MSFFLSFFLYRQRFTFNERTDAATHKESRDFLQQSRAGEISPGWRRWVESAFGTKSGQNDELMQTILHRTSIERSFYSPHKKWYSERDIEWLKHIQGKHSQHNRILPHKHREYPSLTLPLKRLNHPHACSFSFFFVLNLVQLITNYSQCHHFRFSLFEELDLIICLSILPNYNYGGTL